MKFAVNTNDRPSPHADVVLLGVHEEGSTELALAGLAAVPGFRGLSAQATAEKFVGKSGETVARFMESEVDSGYTLLFGLGELDKFTRDSLRASLIAAFKHAKRLKAQTIEVIAPAELPEGVDVRQFGEMVATVASLIDYVINHKKTRDVNDVRVSKVSVRGDVEHKDELKRGLKQGGAIGAAVNLSRDLSNEPAEDLKPQDMVRIAKRIAMKSKGRIKCQVHTKDDLRKMGAGAILAVNRGSTEPAFIIELTFTPSTGATDTVLGFIGKSITFDSGGLDLKPADGMRHMKRDMAGGGSVLGAMQAIAALDAPISIKAILAPTENLPSKRPYKPGDVITTMSGLTVEVDNTDAEGRLTIADMTTFIKTFGINYIIDLATLTGAVKMALHDVGAGGFSNDDAFAGKVLAAAAAADERVHFLPMWPEYRDQNKTDIADLKNSGGAGAGSITAAWFIREFVGDTPWVHLDIAGTAFRDRELGCDPKGSTGYGVRTLVELARLIASGQ